MVNDAIEQYRLLRSGLSALPTVCKIAISIPCLVPAAMLLCLMVLLAAKSETWTALLPILGDADPELRRAWGSLSRQEMAPAQWLMCLIVSSAFVGAVIVGLAWMPTCPRSGTDRNEMDVPFNRLSRPGSLIFGAAVIILTALLMAMFAASLGIPQSWGVR